MLRKLEEWIRDVVWRPHMKIVADMHMKMPPLHKYSTE